MNKTVRVIYIKVYKSGSYELHKSNVKPSDKKIKEFLGGKKYTATVYSDRLINLQRAYPEISEFLGDSFNAYYFQKDGAGKNAVGNAMFAMVSFTGNMVFVTEKK